MLPLAQIDPRTVETIAGGGTRGLITALVVALIALGGVVAWLARKVLTDAADHATTLARLVADHVATLARLNSEHAAALITAHTQATAAVSAAVESATAAATASTTLARDLAAATENAAEVARVLEHVLDREEAIPPRRRSK